MAKRGPRSVGVVLALAGLVLIGLNLVINEVSREGADFGGRHGTTYWPALIGITCLLGGLIMKRYPGAARRIGFAAAGLALIGVNILLNEESRTSAELAGRSFYWIYFLPAGIGSLLLIISVTALGRSTTPADPKR